MGLINFLKSKFSKKDKKEEKESQVTEEKKKVETEEEIENKYIAGLDKSRIGFTESMKKLAKANKVVNDELLAFGSVLAHVIRKHFAHIVALA